MDRRIGDSSVDDAASFQQSCSQVIPPHQGLCELTDG